MNNLGSYKALTVMSKKVGGPENLLLLFFGTGILVSNLDRIIKVFTNIKNKNITRFESPVFTIHSDFFDNLGANFKIGDQYRVIEEDDNSILIEIINDSNNPYFVDEDVLLEISNYGDI